MTEISRRQFALYAVVVVAVILLGGRALRSGSAAGDAGGVAASSAFSAGGEPGTAASGSPGGGGSGASGATGVEVSSQPERLLVHVAGDVKHPGVYELRGGARIEDALRKAGGGRAGADLDVLNLAAKVTDGQQVLVAKRARPGAAAVAGGSPPSASPATGSAASGSAGAPGAALAPVNVNSADATQLEALNGVGPAIAAKIVEWRTQNGPFHTVDDLAQVPGIGPKKLEAMRAQATL